MYSAPVSERRLVQAALRYAAAPTDESWHELAAAAKAYAAEDVGAVAPYDPSRKGPKVDAAADAEVAALRASGLTWLQMAERTGRDVSSLRRAYSRHKKHKQSR